jgi:hypothetical protein
VVSPQHKIFFDRVATPDDPAGKQVFAPAIGLVKLPKIRQKAGAKAVTYYHVMLARHAIIQANGALYESFYPGPTALNMLNWRQNSELIALFLGLRRWSEAGYGGMARRCLTRRRTERLGLTFLGDHAAGSDPISGLGECKSPEGNLSLPEITATSPSVVPRSRALSAKQIFLYALIPPQIKIFTVADNGAGQHFGLSRDLYLCLGIFQPVVQPPVVTGRSIHQPIAELCDQFGQFRLTERVGAHVAESDIPTLGLHSLAGPLADGAGT